MLDNSKYCGLFRKNPLEVTIYSILIMLVMGLTNFAGLYPGGMIYAADPVVSSETFKTAIEAVAAGETGTITLGGNIELADSIKLKEAANITIDLNGHSLSIPEGKAVSFDINGGSLSVDSLTVNGSLTIKDSGDDGQFIISNADGSINVAGENSTFTLESGTLTNEAGGSAVVAGSGGKFIMEGGKIEHSGAEKAAVDLNGGEAEITGGTIDAGPGSAVVLSSGSTLDVISDSIIKNNSSSKPTVNIADEESKLNVYGGEITNNNSSGLAVSTVSENGQGFIREGGKVGKVSFAGVTPYLITYHSNDESEMEKYQYVPIGEKANLKHPVFIDTSDFTFTGWNTKEDGSGDSYKDEEKDVKVSKDMTLYAQWRDYYIITFDYNDKTTGSTTKEVKIKIGEKLTFPANPTRTGYLFAGWFSSKDSDGEEIDTDYEFDADTTVYAHWDFIPSEEYTVSISEIGNGDAEADPDTAAKGDTITIKATPDEGYKFSQWNVISGGVTLKDKFSSKTTFYMPGNNVEIEAVFDKIYKASSITGKTDDSSITGPTWAKSSNKDLVIVIKDDAGENDSLDQFSGKVTLGDYLLKEDVDYEVDEGSISGSLKLTLKKSALGSLANGSYDLKVYFDDGVYTAPIKIASTGTTSDTKEAPKTGER